MKSIEEERRRKKRRAREMERVGVTLSCDKGKNC